MRLHYNTAAFYALSLLSSCYVRRSTAGTVPCYDLKEDEFDAGYGACETYSPGGMNNGWCDQDKDKVATDVLAEDACSECGKCTHTVVVAPGDESTAGTVPCYDLKEDEFDAGYGACETYSPGGMNNGWCDQDKDKVATDVLAEDACSECGKCTHTVVVAPGDDSIYEDIPDMPDKTIPKEKLVVILPCAL